MAEPFPWRAAWQELRQKPHIWIALLVVSTGIIVSILDSHHLDYGIVNFGLGMLVANLLQFKREGP